MEAQDREERGEGADEEPHELLRPDTPLFSCNSLAQRMIRCASSLRPSLSASTASADADCTIASTDSNGTTVLACDLQSMSETLTLSEASPRLQHVASSLNC